MERKNKQRAIAGIIAGVLSLSALGIGALANGSPYENYKEALFNTAQLDNLTANVQMSVSKNGSALAEGTAVIKKSGNDNYEAVNAVVGGTSIQTEVSQIGGEVIMREGDKYRSFTGKSENENDQLTPATKKLSNMLADLLIGTAKEQFSETNGLISLKLDSAQVPELANTALTAAAEITNSRPDKPRDDNEEYDAVLLKELEGLTSVSVNSVDMTAQLDGNGALRSNSFDIALSGTNADGTVEEYVLTAQIDISDTGNTTVSAVDTTGKEVAVSDKHDD